MKFKDFGSYLLVPAPGDHPESYQHEVKRLEWIFIAVRWVWVPIVFLMAWLHHPAQTNIMMAIGGVLGLCNAIACVMNVKVKTPGAQRALGIVMLTIDTLIAWGVIFLFVRDFYTAAYAGFFYIILEAAIRYGLAGSLGMALLFIMGLYGAFLYREAAFSVRFSTSGYAFWTALMTIIAVSVGMIVNEGKKQRRQSEIYLRENTLLSERQRIAHELHDTVLKTLQGLSLEARALGNRATATPSVKETAQYIEDVCSRTSQEIREVIFALRRENTAESIGSQVAKILDDWTKSTGISGDFTLSGRDIVLAAEPARQLRNVVSEALTNVQRHASASRVRIAMKISAEELIIEIGDNGHGIGRGIDEIDTFVTEGKLGIAGMKERVELLGGHFSLNSDRTGTGIGISVPIPVYPPERITDEPDNDSHS
jgi:signal transduction histidine kinase